MQEQSQKQAATNNETRRHIANVAVFIGIVIDLLRRKASEHDRTKLEDPELSTFTEFTEKLAGCTYGTDEYKQFLQQMKPALDHHYARNRHHPEHYQNGVNDMTLVDVIEMVCDWKAATLRHNDGNILRSIEHNAQRFGIDSQLAAIMRNTVELFEHAEGVR